MKLIRRVKGQQPCLIMDAIDCFLRYRWTFRKSFSLNMQVYAGALSGGAAAALLCNQSVWESPFPACAHCVAQHTSYSSDCDVVFCPCVSWALSEVHSCVLRILSDTPNTRRDLILCLSRRQYSDYQHGATSSCRAQRTDRYSLE